MFKETVFEPGYQIRLCDVTVGAKLVCPEISVCKRSMTYEALLCSPTFALFFQHWDTPLNSYGGSNYVLYMGLWMYCL